MRKHTHWTGPRTAIFATLLACMALSGIASAGDDPWGRTAAATTCSGPRVTVSARPKVVGGWGARSDQWPGLVALRLYNPDRNQAGYFCGGSVIAPRWVLTAAHCVDSPALRKDKASNTYVSELDRWPVFKRLGFRGVAALEAVIGAQDLREVGRAQVRQVEQIRIHPQWNGNTLLNDVALLRLEEPWRGEYAHLSLDGVTDPITPPGTTTMVAGFGALEYLVGLDRFRTTDGGEFAAGSPVLREVDLPTVSMLGCQQQYGAGRVGASQLCAGFDDEVKDSCQGDSGGQLVAFDNHGCPYQIGIVSWGRGCGAPKNYGVYTRVSRFAPWIREQVAEQLLAVAPADAPDWARAANRVRIAQQSVEELRKVLGPASDFGAVVLRRENDGQVAQGNRVRLGERYVVEVESRIDGRLVLIDIDAAGEVTQLFPNKLVNSDDATRIKRRTRVRVPAAGIGFDWFRVVEPLGRGQLVALVVPEDFPMADWLAAPERTAAGFVPAASTSSYLMNLSAQVAKHLKGVVLRVDPERWSMHVADYEVLK